MNVAVSIEDLSKKYGKVTALDNVSISVSKGELFGLIGPDGAGKSTMYRILATLLLPDKGHISIEGLDIRKNYRKIRNLIGFMPERFSLYQDLSVMENLRFFASLFGVDMKSNFEMIAPIFGQLEKFPDRKAGALSGGMKQKLALSCALIHRPSILLLDEPTTGVDAVSRSEFWEMLAGLKEKGITILVSTSYMDEATKCERIAMIDKGRILKTDTPHNLVAGLDEELYAAKGSDMFKLLEAIRKLNHISNCYTFGSELHIVTKPDFDPSKALEELKSSGVKDIRLHPAQGTIEDLFIKLSGEEVAL